VKPPPGVGFDRVLVLAGAAALFVYLFAGLDGVWQHPLVSLLALAGTAFLLLLGLGTVRTGGLRRWSGNNRDAHALHPGFHDRRPGWYGVGLSPLADYENQHRWKRGYRATFHVQGGVPWQGTVSTESSDNALRFARQVFRNH
jgi:hypothetical protein